VAGTSAARPTTSRSRNAAPAVAPYKSGSDSSARVRSAIVPK
jgi:hypothetical protein